MQRQANLAEISLYTPLFRAPASFKQLFLAVLASASDKGPQACAGFIAMSFKKIAPAMSDKPIKIAWGGFILAFTFFTFYTRVR